MKRYLIIVAGGQGSRMKSDLPKQYHELAGKPVIIHAISRFLDFDPNMEVVVCVHPSYKTALEHMLKQHLPAYPLIRITAGGDTRFQSVKNGLQQLPDEPAVVGIHDAARPFVSADTIRLCYETAAIRGNAIPCIAVQDSLRKISNNINLAVNRSEYRSIQTPQCFDLLKLKKAFEQNYNQSFTDDATVFEHSGEAINLVEGNVENIKITTPLDMKISAVLAAL